MSSSSSSPRRPLVAMVLEGDHAIEAARQVIGATNPLQAAPGSIRGDYAIEVGQNMVHGSDAPESAAREVGLFFPELRDGRGRASCGLGARPRLALAAAAGDPGAARRHVRGRRAGGVDELDEGPPHEVAIENAYRKAAAVRPAVPAVPGIARSSGSTPLSPSGLGCTASRSSQVTPRTRSGRCPAGRHAVISGVCLIDGDGRARTAAAETTVTFRTLDDDLIAWYVDLRGVARARRRLRDPGPRRGPCRAHRRRLHERRRPPGHHRAAARAVSSKPLGLNVR